MKLCKGCMEKYNEDLRVCPHCGYEDGKPPENALHMIPGSLLADRYIVGKVMGYGGFGVTYIAWDGLLQTKVAIKEYLPSELSTRTLGETEVIVFGGEKQQRFIEGMKKFVDEAKKLAKFNSTEGIVKIFDAFEANNTAYLVMELLEGETIESLLEREKTLSAERTVELMIPVIKSLKEVHEAGIIHRDIAPDNLIITNKGDVKLIDFGSARYATAENEQSLTVMVKKGYSPEEQYRSHGGLGAYTDVYATAATMYRMISGQVPPDSLERRAVFENKGKDNLLPISRYDKTISENYETAIMNALNVRAEDRTPNMSAFLDELTSTEPVARRAGNIKKSDTLKWPLWAKIGIPSAAVLLIVFVVLFSMGIIGFNSDMKTDIEIPDDRTRVPYVVSDEVDDGAQKLTEAQLNMKILGKQESDKIPEDHILSQDVNGGSVVMKNTLVNVKVSSPDLKQVVPDITGMELEKSSEELDELDLQIKTNEQYSNVIEKGCIVNQSIEPLKEVDDESEISVTVSKGREEEIKEKEITVPNLVGMKYSDVLVKAEKIGCTIKVTEREYNKEYERDVTISQFPEADTKIKNTQTIEIIVSLGYETVKVPNVELRTEEKAKSQLSGRGLKSDIRYESNEMILEGLVISQEPKKDTEVYPESTVDLVVSTGAAKIEMPDVVGMQENEANETLVSDGLSVTVDYEHNDSTPEGEVLSQSIGAGSEVKRGDEIIITVATKSEVIAVPDVVGKLQSDAEKEITDNKLTADVNNITGDILPGGIVISQIPKAGINLKENGVVTINIGLFSDEDNISASESDFVTSETDSDNISDTDKKDSDSESDTNSDINTGSDSDTSSRAESTVSNRKDSDTNSKTASSRISSSSRTASGGSSQTSNSPNNTTSTVTYYNTTPQNTTTNNVVETTGISISESEISMIVGDTKQVAAEISPSNATNKNVTWSSNNTDVASVNNGLITANGDGTAIITAAAYNGISVNCTVTVNSVRRENTALVNSGNCGDNGDNVKWELYESGTMYIFGNGNMQGYDMDTAKMGGQNYRPGRHYNDFSKTVNEEERGWYNNLEDINRVVIENGVTSIGSYAFSSARNLKEIDMADSIISIQFFAFCMCTDLENITLSRNLVSIGECAFGGAAQRYPIITIIKIPASVRSIGEEAFSHMTGDIYFMGDKPRFGYDPLYTDSYNEDNFGYAFDAVNAVYYPANNTTWDSVEKEAIHADGSSVTLLPYNP